jgi:hypothetical protein
MSDVGHWATSPGYASMSALSPKDDIRADIDFGR